MDSNFSSQSIEKKVNIDNLDEDTLHKPNNN